MHFLCLFVRASGSHGPSCQGGVWRKNKNNKPCCIPFNKRKELDRVQPVGGNSVFKAFLFDSLNSLFIYACSLTVSQQPLHMMWLHGASLNNIYLSCNVKVTYSLQISLILQYKIATIRKMKKNSNGAKYAHVGVRGNI